MHNYISINIIINNYNYNLFSYINEIDCIYCSALKLCRAANVFSAGGLSGRLRRDSHHLETVQAHAATTLRNGRYTYIHHLHTTCAVYVCTSSAHHLCCVCMYIICTPLVLCMYVHHLHTTCAAVCMYIICTPLVLLYVYTSSAHHLCCVCIYIICTPLVLLYRTLILYAVHQSRICLVRSI